MAESLFYTREHRPNIHRPGEDLLLAAEDFPDPATGLASKNNAVRSGGAGASGEGVRISGATRRVALTGWQQRRSGEVRRLDQVRGLLRVFRRSPDVQGAVALRASV
jgi:hypothetical protein